MNTTAAYETLKPAMCLPKNSFIVQNFALYTTWMASSVWITLSLIGFREGEVLFLMLSIQYHPQQLLNDIVNELAGRPERPNPWCNTLGGIPLDVQLISAFAGIIIAYSFACGEHRTIPKLSWLALFIALIFVPFASVQSGNAGAYHSGVALFVGLVSGFLVMLAINYFAVPYFDVLVLNFPLKRMGYTNKIYHKNC